MDITKDMIWVLKKKNAEFIRYLLREGKNDDEILKITKCSEQELIHVKEAL